MPLMNDPEPVAKSNSRRRRRRHKRLAAHGLQDLQAIHRSGIWRRVSTIGGEYPECTILNAFKTDEMPEEVAARGSWHAPPCASTVSASDIQAEEASGV